VNPKRLDCPRVGLGQGQPIFSGPDPDLGRPSHPPPGPDPGSAWPRANRVGPGSGQGRPWCSKGLGRLAYRCKIAYLMRRDK
jgi:hypothetical protein